MATPLQGGSSPRILLVSGQTVGGIRRHIEALTAEMPARGFEIAFAGPQNVRLPDGLRRFQVEVGDRPRPLEDLRAILRLRRAARNWKPDLVHAQGVKAALLSLLAFPGGAPPVLVTYQNMWHGGRLNWLLRCLAPRARAAIAVSEAVRQSLRLHGIGGPQPAVIPNSVDLERFTPTPSRPERPFTATFLGRLTEEKGVHVLLEAARRLAGTSNLSLPVAGDGPLRKHVEAEAARPDSLVTYLGHQTDVLPLYHGADAVLMPSYSEGLPLTALEAMACAVPVIGTRVGGLPEAVVDGQTGRLLPPGDAVALVSAVEELRADPEKCRRMGEAGRVRVGRQFSQARMLDELEALYRTVA